MADLSLDAYIAKRKMKGGISQRLGPKSPGSVGRGRGGGGGGGGRGALRGGRGKLVSASTQFNVVGLGKFDARQKISSNPLKTTVQDAREKIRARTGNGTGGTFDARQKLDKKKPTTDVRQKIESMKAQKDARSKIKARKGNKVLEQTTGISGNGNQQSVSLGSHGSLMKTIRTTHSPPMAHDMRMGMGMGMGMAQPKKQPTTALIRTVNNNQPSYQVAQPTHRPRDYTSGNLVITKKNLSVSKPVSQAPPAAPRSVPRNMPYFEEYDETPEHYEHFVPRSSSHSQPIQPSAVRAAVQKVSLRQNVPENPTPTLHSDNISSPHGYRVIVTNLHPIVTEDDIIELFGAVGSLKKARLLKPGTAEVIFLTKNEAQAAVRKYHLRELDGLPMRLVLASRSQENPPRPNVEQAPPPQPQAGGPLRLGRPTESEQKPSTIDPTLIHKALFKSVAREDQPTRPVTFTVKI